MSELICPLCNEIIKIGQVRKEWWMSDIDKRVAHNCCITAYEKGITKGKTAVNADLEFAYKRAKVLADMLSIPVHEFPEVTGTILGLVRSSVEGLRRKVEVLEAENLNLRLINKNGSMKHISELEEFIEKLREENRYVNDMNENAHNRSKLLEAKLQSLGAEL